MKERGLDVAWVEEEEEHKLRWLISRLGTAIELRYYLVYMLVQSSDTQRPWKNASGFWRSLPATF